MQETRHWNEDRRPHDTPSCVRRRRRIDYRYFPDPDLLPLRTPEILARVRPLVPELPHEKRARFERDYGCSAYDAGVLASEKALAAWYEAAIAAQPAVPAKKIANWVINDLLGALKDGEGGLSACPVQPGQLAALVAIVEAGKISNTQAREVFAEMTATGAEPAASSRPKASSKSVTPARWRPSWIKSSPPTPKKVAEVQGGNEKAMNWFTGQAMKASQGKANPKIVTEIVRKKVLG